jgi:acyl-coenzyme A thioesterase PaaI-like protein
MSPDVPPAGFEPHDRRSPLTAPWEPIYCNAHGAWVVLGVEICAAHTNSRGLVHGGLVAALLDNVMGLACTTGHDAPGCETAHLKSLVNRRQRRASAESGGAITPPPAG